MFAPLSYTSEMINIYDLLYELACGRLIQCGECTKYFNLSQPQLSVSCSFNCHNEYVNRSGGVRAQIAFIVFNSPVFPQGTWNLQIFIANIRRLRNISHCCRLRFQSGLNRIKRGIK